MNLNILLLESLWIFLLLQFPRIILTGGMLVYGGFAGGSVVKKLPNKEETRETWVQSLGQTDPLEKEMATHPNILDWEISWTEEAGRLQCKESQKCQTELSD